MTLSLTPTLPPASKEDVVVLIDVIRAFTTAAILLHHGADGILCVKDAASARRVAASRLRQGSPSLLTVGEQLHPPFPPVDLANSPSAALTANVRGRWVVLFTVNGTRHLDAISSESPVLCGAVVNAQATASWIRARSPVGTVHLVVTDPLMPEDWACAEHLRRLLLEREADSALTEKAVLGGIEAHGQAWRDNVSREYWATFVEDVRLCARVDSVPQVLLLGRRDCTGALPLRPLMPGAAL